MVAARRDLDIEAPVFTDRKLRWMDISSTLQVME